MFARVCLVLLLLLVSVECQAQQRPAKKKKVEVETPLPPPVPESNVIVVKAPYDEREFDVSKKYHMTVTPNFVAVVILPHPAKQLLVGNPSRYLVWALEEDRVQMPDPQAQGSQAPEVPRNARLICVKPLKIAEDIPGVRIETNLTIRLETGQIVTLLLVNGQDSAQTVDRLVLRDFTAEKLEQEHKEREREESERKAFLARRKSEFEMDARKRLDELAAVAKGGVMREHAIKDGRVRLLGDQIEGGLVLAVEIERRSGKPLQVSPPTFTLDGKTLAPTLTESAFGGQIDRRASARFGFQIAESGNLKVTLVVGKESVSFDQPINFPSLTAAATQPPAPRPAPDPPLEHFDPKPETKPAVGTESPELQPASYSKPAKQVERKKGRNLKEFQGEGLVILAEASRIDAKRFRVEGRFVADGQPIEAINVVWQQSRSGLGVAFKSISPVVARVDREKLEKSESTEFQFEFEGNNPVSIRVKFQWMAGGQAQFLETVLEVGK